MGWEREAARGMRWWGGRMAGDFFDVVVEVEMGADWVSHEVR